MNRWTAEWNDNEQRLKSKMSKCIDDYGVYDATGDSLYTRYSGCVDAVFSNYRDRQMALLNSDNKFTLNWTTDWETNWNEFLHDMEHCAFELPHLIDCFRNNAYTYKSIETDLLWELNDHKSLPHPRIPYYPPHPWDKDTFNRWSAEYIDNEQRFRSNLDGCADHFNGPNQHGCVDHAFIKYHDRQMRLSNTPNKFTLTWTTEWEKNWKDFLHDLDDCYNTATHCFKHYANIYKSIETDLLWELNDHKSLPLPLVATQILVNHTVNTQIQDNAHITKIIARLVHAGVGASVHTIYEQDGMTHILTQIHH